MLHLTAFGNAPGHCALVKGSAAGQSVRQLVKTAGVQLYTVEGSLLTWQPQQL